MMTLKEAKKAIEYYKVVHPNYYKELGGDNITDEKIKEALTIASTVVSGMDLSEDEIFKKELMRLCNNKIYT